MYSSYLFNGVDIRDFMDTRAFIVELVDIVANETNKIVGYFFAWTLKKINGITIRNTEVKAQ